jgi:hypothetical protein
MPSRRRLLLLRLMRRRCLRSPLRLLLHLDVVYLLRLLDSWLPLLSPLRLPVPPSRHFVEVLDIFTFYVFLI